MEVHAILAVECHDIKDIQNLLETLERLCLEYRAWKYIALSYVLNEKPWKLFHDYCNTPERQNQAAALLDAPNEVLQQARATSEVYASLIEALKELSL